MSLHFWITCYSYISRFFLIIPVLALAGSLAGAGAVAAGTAAVAGGAGVLLARNEEEENAKKELNFKGR